MSYTLAVTASIFIVASASSFLSYVHAVAALPIVVTACSLLAFCLAMRILTASIWQTPPN